MEYGIIGPTTCMGDHKVRESFFSNVRRKVLVFLITMLGEYIYTLPSYYSDDSFF